MAPILLFITGVLAGLIAGFILGIHRNTLGRMVKSGLLRDGVHRKKINPESPRGSFLWNLEAVRMTLGVF